MVSDTLALTELGRSKSENAEGTQSLRYRILSHIAEHGDSTVNELADEMNMPKSELNRVINQLVKEEWVIWSNNNWD